MNAITAKSLTFSYKDTAVLQGLDFEVKPGTFVAIAGPNGAGKTTLLKLLCGQAKPKSGKIFIDDKSITSYTTEKLAQKIAIVRQEFIPAFGFSVIETVMMARTAKFGQLGFESEQDIKIVEDALKATDTFEFANRQLNQISGGERQRVFIARALAQDTPILLLDEPTSSLDLRHQVEIYDLLKKMQQQNNKTIVLISHDINLARQYCDNALLLSGTGKFHTGTPAEVFTPEIIEQVFSVTGFTAKLESESFFMPLGKLAKDQKN
jgi:iron complex transport system ATP-binding protein